MSEKKNYYTELATVDVGQYIEKKGQFSYLSWAWAVDQLRRKHPDAVWETKRFKDANGVELPYLNTPGGAFVEVAVTVNGITLSQLHPVMDFKNKSVTNPSSTDVNKAIQRALVKAIALHGLGLYIYAGEDMPEAEPDYATSEQKTQLDEAVLKFATMRGRTKVEVYQALRITNIDQATQEQAHVAIDAVTGWIKKAEEEAAVKA